MQRYFDHMQTKEPHERRRHALGLATVFTGMIFLLWIVTLGIRLNSSTAQQQQASAAAAAADAANQPQLQVSPDSVYSQ